MDKFTRSVDKERCIVFLALFQYDDASGDADTEKEVGRELDNGVDIVIVDQIFADFLLSSATIEYAGELDDSCRAVRR